PPIMHTPPDITTKEATLLPQLKPLPPFSLEDQQGKVFDNQRLLGHWTFLDFGYTHCPDICPTTLALLADLDARLRSIKQKTPYEIAFVSLDPERDSRQRLAEYVGYFDPSFLAVRGEGQALRQLTKPLGILYEKVPTPNSAMAYVMDHSASIALIDPQGRYYALFSPPHDAASMAEDFKLIIQNY
ncbi:MAG: SCO family protein, partial [Chromatiales bacterium]